MKIGVTSQNFRTITGHAGKTRRFLVFSENPDGQWEETGRLDLPKEMSMHEFRGDVHPVDELDVLITASCGAGFKRKLAARGIDVITTSESDPVDAVNRFSRGIKLAPAEPHHHG
ncbi:MAG: NifB/NifX family molybdenum-iron cluster-binding protein [Pseudomonadota bacterium]